MAPAELVRRKLDDYGLDKGQFAAGVRARLAEILDPGYRSLFVGEMQRFADQRTFALLVRGELVGSMLNAAAAVLEPAIASVGNMERWAMPSASSREPENAAPIELPHSESPSF